jgi:hypothetical protein
MKKTVAFAASMMAASLLAGCSGGAGAEKIGLGVVTSIASSSAKTGEAGPKGQVDSLIAAVAVDSGGKITKCWIDSAQTVVEFDMDGNIASDVVAEIASKQEKKDSYGMRGASGIGKEWHEQADAFAAWCVGKTSEQVSGLKTKVLDEHHDSVPDIPELASSVTISVGDFKKAVAKAVANAR